MASNSTTTHEISHLSLQDLKAPASATISHVKHLSSYNWIEAPTPTIAIPGFPPLYSPSKFPKRLKKDSGLVYINQNAARHPDSPLEPLFRSLYATKPSFDIRSMDIVTDRNNIRKLLRFVGPRSGPKLDTFTIGVEVVKNTAIFSRKEEKAYEIIGPREFRGFGHEFEKENTKRGINTSTGHHRVITYQFGGLSFLLRSETDGYVDEKIGEGSADSQEGENEPLSNMLGSLSLSSATRASSSTPNTSKLTLKEDGRVVPRESTLEIKTRVSHKPLEIKDIAPQLWLSQTPKLVRAYHTKGIFQTAPNIEDVTAQIKTWEAGNQHDLKKLAAVISEIVDVVKKCGGKATVIYNEKGDKLVVLPADNKPMLPLDLYSKWNDEAVSKTLEPGSNEDHGEKLDDDASGEDGKTKGEEQV